MNDLLQKLQNICPAHIRPYSPEEMAAIRERELQTYLEGINRDMVTAIAAEAIGRSGIQKRHLKCRFENYHTESEGQRRAYSEAAQWLNAFYRGNTSGFIFAGTKGTGKNHLASAIANDVLKTGGTAMIITVSELMMRMRDTYRKDAMVTEAAMMRHLASIDLLVLDEVGIQRDNNHEQITLNEIINARSADEKPTGILTNLNRDNLERVLGERAIDRIMESGRWVTFNWESYRGRSKQAKNGRAA